MIKDTLKEVVNKWNLQQSAKQMDEIAQEPGIKIGFIGKFSSGKTSLINSLLGTHFPVDINPTTKTICIIEPCKGITKNKYYEEKQGLKRTEIDFDYFIDLCSGNKSGIVVAQVPPSPILPEGCVFVDTPGIDSLKEEDKDTTYSYLAFLDAAVLCVDINEGTLNKDVQDFLLDEKLVGLHDRLVLALTHSDLMKDHVKKETVTQEILKQLNTWKDEGKFKTTQLENKIMLVNSSDTESCKAMYTDMQKHFISKREEIYAQRRHEAYCRLAKDVLAILKDLRNEVYENQEFETQKRKINEEIIAIEDLAQQKKKQIEHLGDDIENSAQIIAEGYAGLLSSASADQIEALSAQMRDEIYQVCQQKIHVFLEDFTLPPHVVKDLSSGIEQKIQFNKDMWDAAKMATAAAIAAATGGAESVGGNIAEAGGGAVVAKEGSQKKVADLLTESANEKKGLFRQICDAIGTAANELNPITHVERLAGPKVKEMLILNFIKSQNMRIIDVVTQLVWEPYCERVINPMLSQLEDKKICLENLKKEEEANFDKYIQNKETLSQDIATLEKELSNG